MFARNLMKIDIASCTMEDTVAKALSLMSSRDCGFIPVTKSNTDRTLIGVVTDRDIAMFLSWADRRPSEMKISECCTPNVHMARLEDNIHTVIQIMEAFKIHRVPVVNDSGKLVGVISLKDLADEARSEKVYKFPEITESEIGEVVEEISKES